MNKATYVSAKEIQQTLGVSKPTAYKIIAQLNDQIKKKDPEIIVFSGYIQRGYYDKCINQCK